MRALEEHREVLLASQVYQYVHLVKLEKGLIEIRPEPEASPKMAQDLGAALSRILETRWIVSVSGAPGAPTLAQVAQARLEAERAEVIQLPILQEILSVFPDAEIQSIETINSKGHDTP